MRTGHALAVTAALVGVTAVAGVTSGVFDRTPVPPIAAVPLTPPSTGPPTPAPSPLGPLLAPAGDGVVPTATGLARALAGGLRDPALGGSVAVSVIDAPTGTPLLERRAGIRVVPASTAKIVTAVAALTALDPQARLTTRVVAGAAPGEVVLVGGGDSTLAGPSARPSYPAVARITDLAAQVRSRLGSGRVSRVLVDDRLYGGARLGPGWRPEYVLDGDVAPVSALSVDDGRVRPDRRARVADPALAAGRALAAALGSTATVSRGSAPAGAAQLGAVSSPSIATLTELMLSRSDNGLAESLARQVALARGRPASFAGSSAALSEVLATVRVTRTAAALTDGSGLSRLNRVQPGAISRLIAYAAREPGVTAGSAPGRFAPVLSGLPVAGYDGTLFRRYRTGPSAAAAGIVRAKTGTLSGVSALAGLVRTENGRLLAFDLTADRVPVGGTRAAEAALDRMAAALAACGCR